jgi:predicted aminopeptidase
MSATRRLSALLLTVPLAGCAAVSYYWQAFQGQMEVERLARPVEDVLADGATSDDLKRRLKLAQAARAYASRELGLPDNDTYRRYADLKRQYVVWNVFAAPELSLTLKTHCFPIAGCVVYRGYFSEAAAKAEADALRKEGADVFIGGVPAYSTLGWFQDPLLNTFIRYPELEVARLVFHELAHQVVYVKDDSTFNESFAVAVEEEGLRRWMAVNATAEQREAYRQFDVRKRELMALLKKTRRALDAAYRSGESDASKRVAKAKIFADMRSEYETLKKGWGGFSGYDAWLLNDLNNAKLGSIATYTQRVAQFAALIAREKGDMKSFYAQVKTLAALPKEERIARLNALAHAESD